MSENEILSEEEVDALMDGVAAGEVAGAPPVPRGEVLPYDLTDQDHIVRGQLPVLEKINARFVRQLEDGFEQMLQRSVEISEEGLQTVRTTDYIHSLGLPVSLNFINLNPLAGEALVVLDPALVTTLSVNRARPPGATHQARLNDVVGLGADRFEILQPDMPKIVCGNPACHLLNDLPFEENCTWCGFYLAASGSFTRVTPR